MSWWSRGALFVVVVAVLFQYLAYDDEPSQNNRVRRAAIPVNTRTAATSGCDPSDTLCITRYLSAVPPVCSPRSLCQHGQANSISLFGDADDLTQTKNGTFVWFQPAASKGCLYVHYKVGTGSLNEPNTGILQVTEVKVLYGAARIWIVRSNNAVSILQSQPTLYEQYNINIVSTQFSVTMNFVDGSNVQVMLSDYGLRILTDVPSTYYPGNRGICVATDPNGEKDVSAVPNLFTSTSNTPFPVRDACEAIAYDQACSGRCGSDGDPHVVPFWAPSNFMLTGTGNQAWGQAAQFVKFDTRGDASFQLVNTNTLNVTAIQDYIPNVNVWVNTAIFITWKPINGTSSTFSAALNTDGSLVANGGIDKGDVIQSTKFRIVVQVPDGAVVTIFGNGWWATPFMGIYISVPLSYYYKVNCGVCGTWGMRDLPAGVPKCWGVPHSTPENCLPASTISAATSTSYVSSTTVQYLTNSISSCAATTTTKAPQATTTPNTIPSPGPPPPPTGPSCIGLTLASEFNAVFFQTYTGSSNVGGKLAVQGDVLSLSTISIGPALKSVQKGYEVVLIVGGAINSFTSGRVYSGNIIVGKSGADLSVALDWNSCSAVKPNTLDFVLIFAEAKTQSAYFSTLPETWTARSFIQQTMTLTLSQADVEIMNVPSDFFTTTVKMVAPLLNMKPGATVIFNVAGTTSGIANINLDYLKGTNVIFNFYQATTLYVFGVNAFGTILAPYASITKAQGSLSGHVIAQSMSGNASIEWNPLTSLCAPRPVHTLTCPPCTSNCNPAQPPPPPPKDLPPGSSQTFSVDFSSASQYNLFVFGDLSISGKVEGKVAVGGNANLGAGFVAGVGLSNIKKGTEVTFLTGGTILQWPSGMNYFGNIVVGSKPTNPIGNVLSAGACARVVPSFLNFSIPLIDVVQQSQVAAAYASTTTLVKTNGVLTVTGSLQVNLEVVNVPANYFDTSFNTVKFANMNAGVLIIFNFAGQSVTIQSYNMAALKARPVLFNFAVASSVIISGTTIEASIMAPLADIVASGANINGRVVVKSFKSTASTILRGVDLSSSQSKPLYVTCSKDDQDCTPPPPPGAAPPSAPVTLPMDSGCPSSCLNMGFLSSISALIFGSFSASSDAQGRVLVGGDASFAPGYSIADQITASVSGCQDPTLVVGNKLTTWPQGRLYAGSIVTGQVSTGPELRSVYPPACCKVTQANFYNFAVMKSQMVQLSSCLKNRTSTVTSFSSSGNTITLSGVAGAIEVISPSDYPPQSNYNNMPTLKNIAPGATVLFNIPGKTIVMAGGDQTLYSSFKVVYNFFEATTITMQNVGVQAHVLAPFADIPNAQGVVWGTVVANSMTGPIQLNLAPLPVCTNAPAYKLPQVVCDKGDPVYGGSQLAGAGVVSVDSLFVLLAVMVILMFM